jgi:hypothetical protein
MNNLLHLKSLSHIRCISVCILTVLYIASNSTLLDYVKQFNGKLIVFQLVKELTTVNRNQGLIP